VGGYDYVDPRRGNDGFKSLGLEHYNWYLEPNVTTVKKRGGWNEQG